MKRWLLTGVVASAAWGGSAAGQSPRPAAPPTSPAPAATDGQPVGGVIVMKTAGQPDRQVRVIRSERMSDGKVVSEVKDLATGEVYTITDVAPGGALDAPAGDASPPRPAAAQRPVMGKVFGSKDGTLPQAKDRAADPLLAAPPGSGAAPATGPEPRQRFLSRVFGAKPTPAGTGTGEQKAAPPATPPARPAAAGGWGPAAKPMIPVPPPVAPAAPPVAPAAPPAQGPVQASMTERAGVPADQMRQEIAQYIQDLRTHSRPSFRMEAATGLCDGRYGSREEIKQALATAAKDDPAAVVRGHCIGCLSQLGYADPEYVRRLRLWADDPEPSVSRAAREALAKFAPRP